VIGALDIGGTKIAAGVVDESGHLLARRERPTDAHLGLAIGLGRMTAMLNQALEQSGGELRGIGVGCTGPVYPLSGRIGKVEFLPGWEDADLAGALQQAFGVPVALENDANAAALGEWAWGSGQGASTFILVTVGTGIGAGLVLDGKLYRGVGGSHPELGHHVIDPSGPACFCGARGCWESLTSGPAMEHWAQARQPQKEPRSARQLCAAAMQGDSLAQAAVHRTAHYLGVGLANLVTLFSPQIIALGGGLMQSYPLFQAEVEATLRTQCGLVPYEQVKIVQAALGDAAGLIGAARAWIERQQNP
jgi:glucokinase